MQAWTFRAGPLALTREQSEPRSHALRELSPGVYSPWPSVEFKAGEVVGYDGPMDRATAAALSLIKQAVPVAEVVPAAEVAATEPQARKRGRPRKS